MAESSQASVSVSTSETTATMAALEIGSLQPFDMKGDPHSISQRWKKWKRAFQLYVAGKGVTSKAQKRGLLLHTAGLDVQELYFTLESEDQEEDFDGTMKVLDDYFIPKANIPFERHLFRQIVQTSEESIDRYVCRLKQRAVTCDFGDREDKYIRDQLIDKCYSQKLRRKFLERDGNVTLGDLLLIARAYEAVNTQLKTMSTVQTTSQVNHVREEKPSNQKSSNAAGGSSGHKKECYSCGRQGHFARDKHCPAKGQKCRCCKETGHFEIKCPKKSNSRHRHGTNHRGARNNSRTSMKGQNSNTNYVDTEDNQREQPFYVFSVGEEPTGDNDSINLTVGGVDLPDVLIDSGATCNLVGRQAWEQLKSQRIQCETRKTAKMLFAYGSKESLPTLGTFTAEVMVAANSFGCQADFVVIDGEGRTLLGRKTAEELGLLHIGPVQVNNVSGENTGIDIQEEYKDLFEGISLLKGYELKLNIDETVKPVAQPVRRIPFALRAKVDEKLDELLEKEIIEEVPEGPTEWVSPLVVVPKSDGDVRVCVDMRRANEAVIRERQPIPTVEEILHDLNGSKVFSRLDLKWGFHQILLSEECRHITTFTTHRGLYRYRRLMFGAASAPEK